MSDAPESVEVRRDAAAGRYEILVDGVVAGFADYGDDPSGVRSFPHTVVTPRFEGRGLAGRMIDVALDDARAEGFAVRPTCSFVAHHIAKNPGSATLAP